MYQADYSDYYTTGSYTYSFAAESALTSGIARVTNDSSYVMYQMTGHGETELDADFSDTLENANVTVESLNLLSSTAIPEEAAAVLINAPPGGLHPGQHRAAAQLSG